VDAMRQSKVNGLAVDIVLTVVYQKSILNDAVDLAIAMFRLCLESRDYDF